MADVSEHARPLPEAVTRWDNRVAAPVPVGATDVPSGRNDRLDQAFVEQGRHGTVLNDQPPLEPDPRERASHEPASHEPASHEPASHDRTPPENRASGRAACDLVPPDQELLDQALLDRVARAFARSSAGRAGPIDADTDFASAGIDSLDLAEIAAELELEFGVVIDDGVFREFTNVRAVADHLAGHA